MLSSDTVARAIRHTDSHVRMLLLRHTASPSGRSIAQAVAAVASSGPPQCKNRPPLLGKHGATIKVLPGKTGSYPQRGSLESRSRTSEGDSFGASDGDGEENNYLDMRMHWAYTK